LTKYNSFGNPADPLKALSRGALRVGLRRRGTPGGTKRVLIIPPVLKIAFDQDFYSRIREVTPTFAT